MRLKLLNNQLNLSYGGGPRSNPWCCYFTSVLLISHWHQFLSVGWEIISFFFTANYWNYSKQSTKLKLDRGPRWNPWYCSFRFFCWSLAGTNIQVSDERWSLYFSQEITQQSNKLKRCGRLLLRRFVCGRVGVMVVCVVLFVCLLDGI